MTPVCFIKKKDSIYMTTNKGYLTILEKSVIKIYNFEGY